jgi:HAD superfamily hydrolase (TIGR01509 family)
VTARALERAYDASGKFLATLWRDNRDVSVMEHVEAILASVDRGLAGRLVPGVRDALVEAYGRPALLVPPRPDEGALQALQLLAAEGYALAVVSNTMRTPGRVLRELLRLYGLLDCFEHLTFSDEVRVRKPDPIIFAMTLSVLGATPGTALHVGDDPMLDVHGAQRAGMRVIQVAHAPSPVVVPRPDARITTLRDLPEAVARLVT